MGDEVSRYRITWSHEEENGNQSAHRCRSTSSRDVCAESDSTARVNDQQEIGLENDSQTSGDESADGEGNECIRQHARGSRSGISSILVGVVDKKGRASDLRTDIAELSHKAEHHVVFLVQWFLGDEAIVESQFRVSGNDAGRAESSLGDFGELAEEEEHRNGNASARDCEVDELHVGERVDIVSGEESLGCDEGTNE